MNGIKDFLPGLPEKFFRDLEKLCPGGVFRGVSLAHISQWRIGGVADLILVPKNVEQILGLRSYFHRNALPHVVVGATTNLLFSDEGLRVPCIFVGKNFARMKIDGSIVTAEAGAWVPGLARRIMLAGLAGAEHICGIPGTLGGLVCMNGGSQRKSISSALVNVASIDIEGGLKWRSREDCGFSYRRSDFQENGEIIAIVRLQYQNAEDKAKVRSAMRMILADRRRKFPRKLPNCGSVFKSDPAMYAEFGSPGSIIEELGFKGHRLGGAIVSTQHANFIVNTGGAKAVEVLQLISLIRNTVMKKVGYVMQAEARFVRPEGVIVSADMV